MIPYVYVESPPDWVETHVAEPPLSEGSGASLTSFHATRSNDASVTLVSGCVATPVPGWVEDMRPSVENRTTGLLLATSERASGAAVVPTREPDSSLVLDFADAPRARAGVGRTFVGFGDGRIATCFVTCVASRARQETSPLACMRAVATARLENSESPPPPGLVLGAATWAIHHARTTAGISAATVTLLGVLAVATRKKPRSRV